MLFTASYLKQQKSSTTSAVTVVCQYFKYQCNALLLAQRAGHIMNCTSLL